MKCSSKSAKICTLHSPSKRDESNERSLVTASGLVEPSLSLSRKSRPIMGLESCHSIGSLSNNVFERRTSTGSGLFSFFDGGFAQIFSQIASITVKKLRNTNFISRHVRRENTSLPVPLIKGGISYIP